MLKCLVFSGALISIAAFTQPGYAQYFGRNKPNYENFDFKVTKSPNFSLYHYLRNDSLVNSFLAASEKWYTAHQKIFKDTFDQKNPIILYNNHPDFWQTNAILGTVGIGTGGVTEALRNRVVMPVMELNAQTTHVLGHELVHAFQYKALQKKEDSLSLDNIQNLPLWMVEGLAEYMSIGNVDAHTAMWMRDALREDDFPTLKDMTRNPKYFPYRYGQAFWSFVAGVFGDTVIAPLFRRTAKVGYGDAIKEITGLDEKAFSEAWKKNLKEYYQKHIALKPDSLVGKLLIDKKTGRMNLAPAISPNGQYVAFLSEKNFFGIDLFLADARTGKVLKTLASTVRESHIDDFSYLESSGTWSPYGDRFAFVSFSKGGSVLSVVDLDAKGKTTTIEVPGLEYFSSPSWSPGGDEIVLSGMAEGHSDLYIYNFKTKRLSRLTEDWYSDVQPQWSPDGKFILFVSDRPAPGRNYNSSALQLCLYDLEKKDVTAIEIFHGAENVNPCFSPDGMSVYFLSNRDGFRNLYRYGFEDGKVYQLTKYVTGISGVTPYSPAISVSSGTGEIAYTYYSKNAYSIYLAPDSAFNETEVSAADVDFAAAVLPPEKRALDIVGPVLENSDWRASGSAAGVRSPYKPRLSLEYIGNQVGLGVSTSSFGTRTGMAGGIDMLFGDMLGNHRLFTSLALNGEIYDFGGQATYFNSKNKINWGISLSHIPYRSAQMFYKPDTLVASPDTLFTTNVVLDVFRAFESAATAFVYFPFSTTRRLELGGGYSGYSFRHDRFNNHYHGSYFVHESREKRDAPGGYGLGNAYAAYVFDNSYFGMASPMRGTRYRLQVEKIYDALDYQSIMADYRHYAFVNPFSFAFRLMHIGRFGKDAESGRLYPLSFAYPTLTRGNSLDNIENYELGLHSPYSINQIFGSRILVANAEWRLPFTGAERLARIRSKLFFTELTWFADCGMAWSSTERPKLELEPESPRDRVPFLSTGLSLRVNVFGMVVIEPYYALPWRGDKFAKGVFGVNFSPGW